MLDNLIGETKIVFAMKSWNLPAFCHVVLIGPRRLRILSPTKQIGRLTTSAFMFMTEMSHSCCGFS